MALCDACRSQRLASHDVQLQTDDFSNCRSVLSYVVCVSADLFLSVTEWDDDIIPACLGRKRTGREESSRSREKERGEASQGIRGTEESQEQKKSRALRDRHGQALGDTAQA